jgi:hypothetical protein
MAKTEQFFNRSMLDSLSKFLYAPQIDIKTQNRIEIIKNFLEKNPQYNFIIYFNHISLNDPAIALHAAEKISPEKQNRHLLVPISYSHSEKGSIEGKMVNYFTNFIDKLDIETIRVIQNYQINHPKYNYTEDEASATHYQYLRRLQELKKTATPTGILISPEGHRSEDGQLAKAESGIIATGRILAPVVYVPVAISYQGKYKRSSINLGKKMNMSIGEISKQEKANSYPSLEELMKKLANALPEEMRGIWR